MTGRRPAGGLDPIPSDAQLLAMREARLARRPDLRSAVDVARPVAWQPGTHSGVLASTALESCRADPLRAKVPVPGRPVTMTRVERLWADHLDTLVAAGELALWRFESVTLVLGADVRYTPDFMLLWRDGRITFDEAKQRWWDDAKAKIRIAARQFPFFEFRVAQKPKGETEFTVTDIPA